MGSGGGRVSGKVGPYVLAEKKLPAAAVEALITELAVVGGNTVADLEVLDFLFDGVSLGRWMRLGGNTQVQQRRLHQQSRDRGSKGTWQ